MMDNPLLALLAPSLLLVPAMGMLSRLDGSSPVRQEVRRKALHILGGLVALSFPLFLTDAWMILIALGLVLGWMFSVRRIPVLNARFGCVLHDAGRASRGELYFALAIAGLLLLAGSSPVYYAIPVLILSLADAAAAIVGRGWPRGRLPGVSGNKTVSGSAAFFVTRICPYRRGPGVLFSAHTAANLCRQHGCRSFLHRRGVRLCRRGPTTSAFRRQRGLY